MVGSMVLGSDRLTEDAVPDVLTAIADIIDHRAFTLPTPGAAANAVGAAGTAFEMYVKDRLVGLTPGDDPGRAGRYRQYLVYEGALNNPPDAMYRGGNAGDAFEMKKFSGGPMREIQLNSSWPKDRLRLDSYGLTDECKCCESWTERDLFYICGGVPSGTSRIAWVWVCDARLMAACNETYKRLHANLQSGIRDIPDITFSPTVELGKVLGCDRAGRTSLRIRGMWTIPTPGKMFEEVAGVRHSERNPTLHALIREEKWQALPVASRERIDSLKKTPGVSVSMVEVPDPNYHGGHIRAVLIRYEKESP